MRLSKAIEGFLLSFITSGNSKNSEQLYRHYLMKLVIYLNDPELESIKDKNIQEFYAYMQTDYTPTRKNGSRAPLSRSSIEKIWIAIRSFYNWAEEDLELKFRPDKKIKHPHVTPPEIEPFSQDEVIALLKAVERTSQATPIDGRKPYTMKRAYARRDAAIILTLLDTGLRVSELSRLVVGDLDMTVNSIRVLEFGSGQKTKPRTVYIGDHCKRALWLYLAERKETTDYQPLFLARSGISMDRNSIRCMLNEAATRAKVKHANPHKFRHTFAVEYLRNGGDVFTLQRQLGHSTLEMVRRYLLLSDTDAATAHRKASPADKWIR